MYNWLGLVALVQLCCSSYRVSALLPSRLLQGGGRAARLVQQLHGKKDKPKFKAPSGQDKGPTKAEKQGKADRFDALTRQFMFTVQGLTKALPDGSRTLLKNINLCFYPGAKIGVVGLNGSGKSTLLKIMAGLDKDFTGVAVPMPGASVGYLAQEPTLEGKTVIENINLGVKKSQDLLDRFTELSAKCAEALPPDEMDHVMNELTEVQNKIDAGNLWEIDRVKTRAMDALRCPPPDAEVAVLSGGERRRVALAKLLLENHDLLLLDEPTNHLDAESVAWLEKYLQDFKGTVVGITHDRFFLENSCAWILEMDRGEGRPYEGNYSAWLEAKNKRFEDEKKQDDRTKKILKVSRPERALPRPSSSRILSLLTSLLASLLTSPTPASPRLTSPHLTSPRLASPRLASPAPHLASPRLTSPHLTSHRASSNGSAATPRPGKRSPRPALTDTKRC